LASIATTAPLKPHQLSLVMMQTYHGQVAIDVINRVRDFIANETAKKLKQQHSLLSSNFGYRLRNIIGVPALRPDLVAAVLTSEQVANILRTVYPEDSDWVSNEDLAAVGGPAWRTILHKTTLNTIELARNREQLHQKGISYCNTTLMELVIELLGLDKFVLVVTGVEPRRTEVMSYVFKAIVGAISLSHLSKESMGEFCSNMKALFDGITARMERISRAFVSMTLSGAFEAKDYHTRMYYSLCGVL
jgi:hypothetical protein